MGETGIRYAWIFSLLALMPGASGCYAYDFDFSTWDTTDTDAPAETSDLDVQTEDTAPDEEEVIDVQPDDGPADPDGADADDIEEMDGDATDGDDMVDADADDPELEPEGECGNGDIEPPEECDGDMPQTCTHECPDTSEVPGIRECIECVWVCNTLPDDNCDDIDQDCDTTPDDEYVPYQCGEGVCEADSYCEGGREYCDSGDPTGEDTDCNGIDEDCSGEADDNYEPTVCGQGVCEMDSICFEGEESCEPGDTTGTDDDCDGLDDNCNGMEDENYLPAFTCGDGVCEEDAFCSEGGVEDCEPGGPWSSTDPTCDGNDDDCDTTPDDDYEPHTCGQSLCERESTCIDGDEDCTPGEPSDEICWNEIDENCDTVPDDGCTTCETPVLCPGAVNALASDPTGGRFTGVTGGGSAYQGTCGGGSAPEAVYYVTIPPERGDVDIFATTHGSSFDTVLYARSCECEEEEELTCNDNADTLATSNMYVRDVHPGTYLFFVDGKTGADMGEYQIDIYVTETGANGDRCGNPFLLTPAGYEYSAPNTTCNMSKDYVPNKLGDCGWEGSGETEDVVFYFWVPADATVLSISTCLSITVDNPFDTSLYVRSVCNDASLPNQMGCNEDSDCFGEPLVLSTLALILDRGLYYIFVDGYDWPGDPPPFRECGEFYLSIEGL